MKKFLLTLVFIIFACSSLMAQDRNNEDEVVKLDEFSRFNAVEGELIVKFSDNTVLNLQLSSKGEWQSTGIENVDRILSSYSIEKAIRLCPFENPSRQLRTSKSYNGKDVVERDLSRLCLFKVAEDDPSKSYELIELLKNLPEVEFAEPNYIVSALGVPSNLPLEMPSPRDGSYFDSAAYTQEPMYAMQWGIPAVNLPQLWAADANTSTDRSIIAILDTGVDPDHPDLAANIWTNENESGESDGYDNDNNGFIDDLHGWDFVNQTGDMNDFNSHGTHCAGIAAAVGDNGIGITGANPNALIMPVAVMQSNGSGDIATIIQGINYASNNGADVISMSLGTYASSIALEQALAQAYQNCVLVAAAGNDGLAIDPRCGIPSGLMYPGAFTFVFGVEATEQTGSRTIWSNYDCDGPSYSQYSEEKLYNYELQAPGAGIISTIPGGQYRTYNGTSMSCPLVAGGISALLHAKPYPSQEMLWGDLINTSGNHVDFLAAYNAGEAPAQLQFVTYEINDTLFGDGDYRPDAGETIEFYPTIRTTWGATDSITIWLEFAEFEDTTTLHILNNHVDFGWSLSAYAKSKSVNPIVFKIDSAVVDGRNINLELHATSPNSQNEMVHPFTIQVENGVELGGMIYEDLTLYPNVHYIVTQNLAITEDATLSIKPGTILKFKDGVGLSSVGTIHAVGTPDSLITFTKTDLGQGWGGMRINYYDTLQYCVFENAWNQNGLILCSSANIRNYCTCNDTISYFWLTNAVISNSIIRNNYLGGSIISTLDISNSSIYNNSVRANTYFANYVGFGHSSCCPHQGINVVSNIMGLSYPAPIITQNNMTLLNLNWFGNYQTNNSGNIVVSEINLSTSSSTPGNYPIDGLLYLGSAKESIVREHIYDFEYPGSTTYGRIDLTNMATRPTADAPGIVWKVEVNGFDSQDEFDSIPPLGVGTHEFKVYFNRAMDVSVAPMVSMGVRPPYTQNAIGENGSWSADSTIYTVSLKLTPSQATDGLNRIYVANAKDNQHFEIPVENRRFNVQVSTAGSMSTGFMATAGIGKIDLEWNNNEIDFNDFLGYNMYRYQVDTAGVSSDTLMLNTSLIQDTLFTDFEVVPGERYYYFYKVLRTNLTENNPSKVVTTIPLSSILGDANGSFAVDVADIVTTVSYITNQSPQPFLFGAADVNSDGVVDVLDIVGIINIILNPDFVPDKAGTETAIYTIEEGILYVETPVELGGIQVVLNRNGMEVLEALSGFEQVEAQISDGQYLFLAYSMSGKTLKPGKHALLRINDALIESIALSDPMGTNVEAVAGNITAIISYEATQIKMGEPYPNPFKNGINIPFTVNANRSGNIELVITDIMGRIVESCKVGERTKGEQLYIWTPNKSLATGIYIIGLYHDGVNVQRVKIVKQ